DPLPRLRDPGPGLRDRGASGGAPCGRDPDRRGRPALGAGADRLPRRAGGGGLSDGACRRRPPCDDPQAGRGRGAGVKHTLVARVQDQPGVLNRVTSLFRRRNFNIESLTVGGSESPSFSRMTLVVDTARVPARLVEANLKKLV